MATIDPNSLKSPTGATGANGNTEQTQGATGATGGTKPENENPAQGTLDPDPKAAPQPQTEAQKAADGLKKGGKAYIHNPNIRQLRDPFTGDKFPAGQTVYVKELGNWTIMQVSANILRVGKAENVGKSAEDHDDFVGDDGKKKK